MRELPSIKHTRKNEGPSIKRTRTRHPAHHGRNGSDERTHPRVSHTDSLEGRVNSRVEEEVCEAEGSSERVNEEVEKGGTDNGR